VAVIVATPAFAGLIDKGSVAVNVPDVTFTATRFPATEASAYTTPDALDAACVTASPSETAALRKLAWLEVNRTIVLLEVSCTYATVTPLTDAELSQVIAPSPETTVAEAALVAGVYPTRDDGEFAWHVFSVRPDTENVPSCVAHAIGGLFWSIAPPPVTCQLRYSEIAPSPATSPLALFPTDPVVATTTP
jgi:hypothetical protein